MTYIGNMMGRAFEYRRAAKERRWDRMSRVFPKLSKAITAAARHGGPDPFLNAKLRVAISNAKSQNMPKDNIQAAIRRAGAREGSLSEITYEGRAQHGVLLFIECLSDNPTRTTANIKSYFNRTQGASVLVNGSIDFMFDSRSAFEISLNGNDLDDIELFLIDYGLIEIEHSDPGSLIVYASREDFGNLSSGLDLLNVDVRSSRLVRVPNRPICLDDAKLAELDKLLSKLDSDEDVIEIFTNVVSR